MPLDRVLTLLVLMLVAVFVSGCEAIGTIFQAGLWVGVIMVVVIVAIVGVIAAKIRH